MGSKGKLSQHRPWSLSSIKSRKDEQYAQQLSDHSTLCEDKSEALPKASIYRYSQRRGLPNS